MKNNFHQPSEVIDKNIELATAKAKLHVGQMLLLGIIAGMFIGFGGAASNVATYGFTDIGTARLVKGLIFPVGLMMIVFVGGELFTGNCLMIMATMEKRISWGAMNRNLVIVYIANLLGAFMVSALVMLSGQLNYSNGALGAYTINIAVGKVAITPLEGITSGILCNILVCLAILMAGAAKDITGKIWAIFFPILTFVVSGYEHCVANMYYMISGILASTNPSYVAKAEEIYGITQDQIASLNVIGSLRNLIPVTIGNIIGGAIFVGLIFAWVHRKEWHESTVK